MQRRQITAILLLSLTGWLACAPSSAPPDGGDAPLVAVSLPPQAWLVERIAGERVRVEVILPPAASPETWAAAPEAMLTVGRADLYFSVGHPSLAFESRLRSLAETGGTPTVDFGGADGAGDPHPWLDLDAVRAAAERLSERLAQLDPDGAAAFASNVERLHREIEALDRRLGELLAERVRSVVVVQHPAWGPLLARYGIEELAVERDGKEPDPATLIALVERVRRERLPVVFVQRGLSPRSARLIAAETGARLEELDPLAREWPALLEEAAGAFAAAVR